MLNYKAKIGFKKVPLTHLFKIFFKTVLVLCVQEHINSEPYKAKQKHRSVQYNERFLLKNEFKIFSIIERNNGKCYMILNSDNTLSGIYYHKYIIKRKS